MRAGGAERASGFSGFVQIIHRRTAPAASLSASCLQRVATAHALANHPSLLLADEPTGNLDPKTADSAFSALVDLVRAEGLAALVAMHNSDLAAKKGRSLLLHEAWLIG